MLDMLKNRRSIRQFRDEPVSDDAVNAIVEAMLRAPSSRSRKPCRFVVVRDEKTRNALSTAKAHGAAFLAKAPLNIVIAADTAASDAWIEDCSIAAITVQYMAETLGLGSTWAQIRMRTREDGSDGSEYARSLLGMPETFAVEAVIGIGHPTEKLHGHPVDSLDWGNVKQERW